MRPPYLPQDDQPAVALDHSSGAEDDSRKYLTDYIEYIIVIFGYFFGSFVAPRPIGRSCRKNAETERRISEHY